MPFPIIRAYLDALPRQQARDSLTRIQEGLIASGNLKKWTATSLIRKLERAANRGIHRPPQKFANPELAATALAVAGIGVEVQEQ